MPPVFPGARGFALLEYTGGEPQTFRGQATECRYPFAPGQRRYVDRRDMPGLPREAFRKAE